MSTSALFDQMFAVKNQFFTFETLMKLFTSVPWLKSRARVTGVI